MSENFYVMVDMHRHTRHQDPVGIATDLVRIFPAVTNFELAREPLEKYGVSISRAVSLRLSTSEEIDTLRESQGMYDLGIDLGVIRFLELLAMNLASDMREFWADNSPETNASIEHFWSEVFKNIPTKGGLQRNA